MVTPETIRFRQLVQFSEKDSTVPGAATLPGEIQSRKFKSRLAQLADPIGAFARSISDHEPFRVSVIYADADGTLKEKDQRLGRDMARRIAEILARGTRFVIVSSNRADELRENVIKPIEEAVSDRRQLLSRFEVFFANGLGHMAYAGTSGEFACEIAGSPLPDEFIALMFKVYITAFFEFLSDPRRILNEAAAINEDTATGLQRIWSEQKSHAARFLAEAATPETVKEGLAGLLGPYTAVMGKCPYVDTWADAFATFEVAECREFLHGTFTEFLERRSRELLVSIPQGCGLSGTRVV